VLRGQPLTCTNTKKLSNVENGRLHPYINCLNTSCEIDLFSPLVYQYGFYCYVQKDPARIRPKKRCDSYSRLLPWCDVAPAIFNKWIVADVWVDIINGHYDIPDDLQFTSKELNADIAINKVYKSNNIETTVMVNPMGLYKAWFNTCKDEEGKQTSIAGYYATSPNTLPAVHKMVLRHS
jgi:hypothetical protein